MPIPQSFSIHSIIKQRQLRRYLSLWLVANVQDILIVCTAVISGAAV